MPNKRKDNDNDGNHRDQGTSEKATHNEESSQKEGKHQEYDEWNREDLLLKAGELGIKERAKMDKQELIKAIRDH